jgi:hypothetical protein
MVNGKRTGSVTGAGREVIRAAVRRNERFRQQSNDPTTRLARSQKAIRKGTMNLNRIFDPSSKAERLE